MGSEHLAIVISSMCTHWVDGSSHVDRSVPEPAGLGLGLDEDPTTNWGIPIVPREARKRGGRDLDSRLKVDWQ